ncbi:MAG: hypothetical protein LBQ84_06675 [Flavobacteriaceae bacterium]|jgi:hypothetical protein|nr:hypothetical protein [Flavobacteriaceae bacterium]
MKRVLILLTLTVFSYVHAQVGINTEDPNSNTLLHISEFNETDPQSGIQKKGILIPRLSKEEIGNFTSEANGGTGLGEADNGLMIYNEDDGCFSFWNGKDKNWKSVCGGELGKSEITVDCNNIKVVGSYVKDKELTSSNYLSVKVNVTTPGEYTISAITNNGYNFFTTGIFLTAGEYTVQVPGQGTPIETTESPEDDIVTITVNGVKLTCQPVVHVTELSTAGTYTMSCGTATVNGIYKVGVALNENNTIILPVNVATQGSYTITSNEVDGISFSSSGTLNVGNGQTITLNGHGIPTTTYPKTITLTSNSQGGVVTSCTVIVRIVIPAKKVLHVGPGIDNSDGASAYNGASRNMMDAKINFGQNEDGVISKVKTEGFTTHESAFTLDALKTELAKKPDIVILGGINNNDNFMNSDDAIVKQTIDTLAGYLFKKGVVILFCEETGFAAKLMQKLFLDPTITSVGINEGGAMYQLSNIINDDVILEGPFGDIRGKYWGEHNSRTAVLNNLPMIGITAYSKETSINRQADHSRISMFKHNTLNLFFVGDGGFIINNRESGTIDGNTVYPFATDLSTKQPAIKSYGIEGSNEYPYAAGSVTVVNSILFGNVLAWALERAEHYGINTQ